MVLNGKRRDQVENVKGIQRLLGVAWTTVKFYFDDEEAPDVRAAGDLRFCEAVLQARSGPLMLRAGDVSCPGARYVFGWDSGCKEEIAAELVGRRGMERDIAENLIAQVPVLREPPQAIGLNSSASPDLIVSYCQPPTAMELLKLWQSEFGGANLPSRFSSILSVCGNVAVGCYLSHDVSLSFGCDDAREFAGIGRDRLVIGIPYSLIGRLLARNGALGVAGRLGG
jgi:uncharacterized protein (DUF169 family)